MTAQHPLLKIFSLRLEDEQAAFEERKFTEAMLKKFIALLTEYRVEVPTPERFHPAMAWPVFRGVDDPAVLQLAIDTYTQDSPLEPVEGDLWWIDRSLKFLSDSLTRDTGEVVELFKIETPPQAKTLSDRALQIMEAAWPEAHRQFRRIVRKIVFVDSNGPNFMSATGAYAYSAMFIKFNPEWNAINLLDVLLHENGHQSLMIKQTFGRVIENLTDKAKSPLRKDPRWLNGILHAAFVLWRVNEGFRRVKANNIELSPDEEETLRAQFTDFIDKIDEALTTLREKGNFTEIGDQFIEQMAAENENFKLDLECLFAEGMRK